MADSDYEATEYPGTTAGLQEAIDSLAGGKGKVFVGPGTLSTTAPVWIHSNCHLQGAGIGVTIIQRATGSLTDADDARTGLGIGGAPYGSNGTLFSSGSQGSNVTISDLTIDGNYSNFTSLTDTALTPLGIRLDYVTGLTIHNVKIQNTLQGGFYFNSCKGLLVSDIYTDTVGQWSVSSSRNALTLTNNDDTTTLTNQGTITNCTFLTTGDEAIVLVGTQGVTISNVTADGCDFVVEFTGSGSVDFTDNVIRGIVATNIREECITLSPSASDVYRCNFSDMVFNCHTSAHEGSVIYMATSTIDVADCSFSNITATNINSTDSSAVNWIDIQSGTGKSRVRLRFQGLRFSGVSSTRTNDIGANIRHTCSDIHFTDCRFKDVAGIGIALDDAAADTESNIHFDGVEVDGANYFGTRIRNNTAAATMKEIYFDACLMKDCAKQAAGSNAGWQFSAGFAGSSINNIYLRGCRSYKTSGTNHAYGVNLLQTAGTLDSVIVEGCDFSGTNTAEFVASGTMTNIRFRPRAGKGTAIASAATIAIPTDGDVFHVTGTTNVTNGITVNPWDNGRYVRLIFDDVLTVSDTGTSVLQGDFTSAANDVFGLTCDGTNWVEVSRN